MGSGCRVSVLGVWFGPAGVRVKGVRLGAWFGPAGVRFKGVRLGLMVAGGTSKREEKEREVVGGTRKRKRKRGRGFGQEGKRERERERENLQD